MKNLILDNATPEQLEKVAKMCINTIYADNTTAEQLGTAVFYLGKICENVESNGLTLTGNYNDSGNSD